MNWYKIAFPVVRDYIKDYVDYDPNKWTEFLWIMDKSFKIHKAEKWGNIMNHRNLLKSMGLDMDIDFEDFVAQGRYGEEVNETTLIYLFKHWGEVPHAGRQQYLSKMITRAIDAEFGNPIIKEWN